VLLLGLLPALAQSPASASDNSKSKVIPDDLLSSAESTMPVMNIRKRKTPSAALIEQQLAAQAQILAQAQAGLAMAQAQLTSAQKSPDQFGLSTWTQAVATDEVVVARVLKQMAELNAELATASP